MSSDLTLVLGLGSPLMGDDGLGLVALETLRSEWTFDPAVELVDGGTWGMMLLPQIEEARRLLIVDAIRAGGRPGDLVELDRDALPRGLGTKLSPHQIDLREVLALADLRGRLPMDAVALGVEPDRVEMDAELSECAAASVPRLVERIVARLRSWGHEARRIGADGGVEAKGGVEAELPTHAEAVRCTS
ncbi:MAG TPA: HyaD/HybD family hydrogenase maturation endopeptidase [Longimicrobiales bacterium]|nr:HyaD/HybD family hydrogenase maturation endopeptidase [Longimicrobiales bacterium]